MDWYRVDNRLIHGQVIETWIPFTGASVLVVCSDALAADPLQQDIMSIAVPSRIALHFCPVAELSEVLAVKKRKRGLVLFSTCPEAYAAYSAGNRFPLLNIGNLHYAPGKMQIYPNAAVDDEDMRCLGFFKEEGVELDFRAVPNDPVTAGEW